MPMVLLLGFLPLEYTGEQRNPPHENLALDGDDAPPLIKAADSNENPIRGSRAWLKD